MLLSTSGSMEPQDLRHSLPSSCSLPGSPLSSSELIAVPRTDCDRARDRFCDHLSWQSVQSAYCAQLCTHSSAWGRRGIKCGSLKVLARTHGFSRAWQRHAGPQAHP